MKKLGSVRSCCGLLGVLLCGCGLLDAATDGNSPPQAQVSDLQLRKSPALSLLAAYYCPRIIDDPIARLACAVTLGAPPPTQSLGFQFGLGITAHNPNNVPVPALDVLVALTLFPGAGAQSLGAICLSLCGADDPSCTGAPRPGACQAGGARTLADYAAQVPGLIAAVASGQAQEALRRSTPAAGGDVRLDLAFDLGLQQALDVFQQVALRYVQDYLAGRQASLDVPVSAEGTLFVKLPLLGVVGVGYGPIQATWHIN